MIPDHLEDTLSQSPCSSSLLKTVSIWLFKGGCALNKLVYMICHPSTSIGKNVYTNSHTWSLLSWRGSDNQSNGDNSEHFGTIFPRRHSWCCTQLNTQKVMRSVKWAWERNSSSAYFLISNRQLLRETNTLHSVMGMPSSWSRLDLNFFLYCVLCCCSVYLTNIQQRGAGNAVGNEAFSNWISCHYSACILSVVHESLHLMTTSCPSQTNQLRQPRWLWLQLFDPEPRQNWFSSKWDKGDTKKRDRGREAKKARGWS